MRVDERFGIVRFGDLAHHRLHPVVLVDRGDAFGQTRQFDDLRIVEIRCTSHQLTVRQIRQTMDDFRVRVTDGGHVEQPRRLIGDDEPLAIGAHLRDGIGQHLNAFAQKITALGALFHRGSLQQIMSLLQHRQMTQRLIHAIRGGHAMLLKLEHDKTHQQGLGLCGTHA